MGPNRVTPRQFFARLRWLDGAPLLERMEPYRLRLFDQFFDSFDPLGRPVYNLGLFGRAKKNWKTTDLVLSLLYALFSDSPAGSQVYAAANDEDQADDDLDLCKKLLRANPSLEALTVVKSNVIERRDGDGFIEILPARDAVGQHGKTFRLFAVDEIHGYRNWDLLEAMAHDPSRRDTQTAIWSYASIFHRPGVPLFDMYTAGRAGLDPRMLFSWYAADFTTDPDFQEATPEARANPSLASWNNPDYLEQQKRRLPSHKFRRLHLNLPGQPQGSAYQPEPVMSAIERGVKRRPYDPRFEYAAFVDMSGGSADDATLAIGHLEDGRVFVDRVVNQGPSPPFDPRLAVTRFVAVCHEYGISRLTQDRYAGLTFVSDFQARGMTSSPAERSKGEMYAAFEPKLNAGEVTLPDEPLLEQQLLGLVWRGGKIDHPISEHDDWANAAVGVVEILTPIVRDSISFGRTTAGSFTHTFDGFGRTTIGGCDNQADRWGLHELPTRK